MFLGASTQTLTGALPIPFPDPWFYLLPALVWRRQTVRAQKSLFDAVSKPDN